MILPAENTTEQNSAESVLIVIFSTIDVIQLFSHRIRVYDDLLVNLWILTILHEIIESANSVTAF